MNIEKLKLIHRKLWGFGFETEPTKTDLQNLADDVAQLLSELQEGDGWISVKVAVPVTKDNYCSTFVDAILKNGVIIKAQYVSHAQKYWTDIDNNFVVPVLWKPSPPKQ